jgi:hypothetical protein
MHINKKNVQLLIILSAKYLFHMYKKLLLCTDKIRNKNLLLIKTKNYVGSSIKSESNYR